MYLAKALHIHEPCNLQQLENAIVQQDLFEVIDLLPKGFADLLIIDPPYNLSKDYNGFQFKHTTDANYEGYLKSWLPKVIQTLKPNGSVYVCCDWKCSSAVYNILSQYVTILNRITWQREKGRGAKSNWKNAMEDIWFGVVNPNAYGSAIHWQNKRSGPINDKRRLRRFGECYHSINNLRLH